MDKFFADFNLTLAELKLFADIRDYDSVSCLKIALKHAKPIIGGYIHYVLAPIIGPKCISWIIENDKTDWLTRSTKNKCCLAFFMKPEVFEILWLNTNKRREIQESMWRVIDCRTVLKSEISRRAELRRIIMRP